MFVFFPCYDKLVLTGLSNRYNQLRDDAEQPQVPQYHLDNLARIFTRHNAQSKFGLHLIHGHFKVQRDMVMLGTNFANPSGCWTKPTKIEDINSKDIHGHIFMLSPDNRLIAYEYREGPPNDIDSTDPGFFRELIEYLQNNGLSSVLGLQVLYGGHSNNMVEMVLEDVGTVMLDASETKHGGVYRVTGWRVDQDGGMVSFSGGESHAKTTKGTHQVFVGGKALPDIAALKSLLKDEGII